DPTDLDCLRKRALVFMAQKNWGMALQDINALFNQKSTKSSLLYRSKITRKLGQYESALSDISKLIRLHPENETYLLSRAKTYKKMGDYSKSLEDLKPVLKRRFEIY